MSVDQEEKSGLNFATFDRLEDTPDPFLQIRELGLEAHAAELDEYGYTIVPPEKVGPPGFIAEVRERMIELAAKQFELGVDDVNDPATTVDHPIFFTHQLLGQGEVFERVLMNPVSLALISHLLGESCVLSSMTGFMKGPGENSLELHTDNVAIPSPFPPYSQVANSTLIMSDYSAEMGSLCFAPRSHKLGRHPLPSEVSDSKLAVPVEAEAGSLIVFHGNTWHGAQARRAPGYRFTLIQYFVRMYLLRQENVDYVTDEMRARNSPRFRRLVGDYLPYPFSLAGQDKMFAANAAGKYQHT